MRPAARAALALLPAVWSVVMVDAGTDYGIPVEIKLWDTGRTPLSHMVDVTNEFGLKVLAEHNFLNDNNIAFSPYGLMGILVALYEGVDGESSYQIQRGLQLPWNRNVMRVGFRDIHRTLKTYFVPEEGFLAGLALNNENVTFNESYKKILRFYGFDLENDQLPSLPSKNGTNETATSSVGDGKASMATTTSLSTAGREELSTTLTGEGTTSNPNAETFNDIDVRIPTSVPTTASPSSTSIIGNINFSSTTDWLMTTDIATVENVFGTVPAIEATTAATTPETSTSTVPEITTPMIVIPSSIGSITTTNPFQMASSATTAAIEETERTSIGIQASTASASSFDASTELAATDSTNGPFIPSTSTQVTETVTTEQSTIATDTSLIAEISTPGNSESIIEGQERRKKSIVNFIFTSPPYISDDVMYRGFDIPIPASIDDNLGSDQMFLANGLKSVQVSYMHYDAVLEHAHLPHLEAAALRLPLDSARYYLLALLPARAAPAALARLVARLARHSDLRDVYAALRPKRVKAVLPSFTVKGHVILTADLQKLGVRDVFEPRQRDFSPMTSQPGVHVRSVEQAVSVALRKYAADDRNASRYTNLHPVHFSATYPFLYFVMDASIHVALMAGKMVDPLNSRII